MTESKWLNCSDPHKMVEYLHDRVSDRKLRLFGCACCRRVWEMLTEPCFRRAVEVAERFVDGHASKRELAAAKRESGVALEKSGRTGVPAVQYCAFGSAWSTTRNAETASIYPTWVLTDEANRRWQVSALLDIFGNPFRPITADSRWLSRNVIGLVGAIYDERAFDRMPILADALEDAGCAHAAILDHCRGGDEHVRGCWVLDLLLGKK